MEAKRGEEGCRRRWSSFCIHVSESAGGVPRANEPPESRRSPSPMDPRDRKEATKCAIFLLQPNWLQHSFIAPKTSRSLEYYAYDKAIKCELSPQNRSSSEQVTQFLEPIPQKDRFSSNDYEPNKLGDFVRHTTKWSDDLVKIPRILLSGVYQCFRIDVQQQTSNGSQQRSKIYNVLSN
ncbi:hypothetical protein EVAR_839_1 [Eumeta japonica]|uniref:Uncharacterized protein n=1 Tax=Eumeta variegata TaxID=151549 RepID=A0A4C1SDV1_EUMVA|nr:hypothetical protein EVAR_839_1 [Eumeta japonica]